MPFKFVFLPPNNAATRSWAARLATTMEEVHVAVADTIEQAQRELVDADAAFGTIPPDLLKHAQRLRWLQAPAAAPPAGYYSPELIEHPVVITNFRGIYNDHIATHVMAFVLGFARGMQRYIPQQLRQEWKPAPANTGVIHLPAATVLVIGVGGIGAEVARLCAAFGMRVVGVDARRQDLPTGVAEMHPPDALDHLLPHADFVILTVPHTPQTEGMMHTARFTMMKSSAFLINIGRGMTVKLDDLNHALRQGDIAGAGLDVFEIEPLPSDHPLWTAPNVLLTPHTAGYGPDLDERRWGVILENARRFAQGAPLENVVDKHQWF